MSLESRWKQRLATLRKAHERLHDACRLDHYSDLEIAGLIQTYEFTYELAWKTMKDKLAFDGYAVNSPRGTILKAFETGLIADAEEWLDALETRNLFSHTYNDVLAQEAIHLIKTRLALMLQQCVEKLISLAGQ